MSSNQNIIEPLVPEEVYTDRQEHIDYFYKAALKAITRRTMSTVLLGQRRMGKTEIFKRVVNALFNDQKPENNDKVVIPVFYQFSDESLSKKDFAICYIENFLRWVTAFHLKQPERLTAPGNIDALITFIENNIQITKGIYTAIDLLKAVIDEAAAVPEQRAIMLPKNVAFLDDITIAMFLDEFQNTRLPHLNFSIVGFFQEAVESPRCPHFVTGSAMSILTDEILGKGALYGRFDYHRIERFTDYYGEELVFKVARYYGANIHPEMPPIISDRCGGNPFYITAIVKQAAKQQKNIDNEDTLNKLLAIDISSGFIWMELSDQVNRWIQRINEHGITKWILYLAAIEEGDEIDLHRIQRDLKTYEYVDVPISKIKEVMIKLARGDLIKHRRFGNWFTKINDPILNEFLKVWGEIDVVKYKREEVEVETIKKFQTIARRIHEYKGYLAEVYMIQILWNSQRKKIPGKFFNNSEEIPVPQFVYINQRHRRSTGKNIEIDIFAHSGTEIWLAESKWHQKPVGEDVVRYLLKQSEIIIEQEGEGIKTVKLWLFSYAGVSQSAQSLLNKHNILWSTKDDLNQLLEFVKLRKLPEMESR